jgi:hypothetical protein
MKALDKDRTRRYSSPIDLASDLSWHLSNDPVLAAPPTAAYRLQKFVKRHSLKLDDSNSKIVDAQTLLSESLMALGRAREAEALLKQNYEALWASGGRQSEVDEALRVLVEHFEGRGEKARTPEYRALLGEGDG